MDSAPNPALQLPGERRGSRRVRSTVVACTVVACTVAFAVPDALATTRPDRTADAGSGPAYATRKVATVPGAVRVVERSPLDPFVYVVSRRGTVTRMQRDGSGRRKVLDVSTLTTTDGERGLLGLAFRKSAPAWEAFVNYTDLRGDTVVARWRVRADGSFVRQPGLVPSVVITIRQPYSNHNGGDLNVGPDNMLYIGMGDGGSGGDPQRRAMDMTSLLGKILRIDPTPVTDGRGHAYRIPAGNPFVGKGRPEIWSTGLRNPWRFTFDGAGNMWVTDVGQNQYEEVSFARAGDGHPGGRRTNFGWSAYEGLHPHNGDVPATGVLMPVLEYDHSDSRCSISGAAVATSRSLPGRSGWFLYGDFCSGTIAAFTTDGRTVTRNEVVAEDLGNITSVNQTSRAVYYTTLDGSIGTVSTK